MGCMIYKKKTLHSQIYECLILQILSGKFEANSIFFSIREMSRKVGISEGTMQKVYQSLRKDGYINKQNARYYVANVKEIEKLKKIYVMDSIEDLQKNMHDLGIKRTEVICYINQ